MASRTLSAVVIVAVGGAGLTVFAPTPCDVETAYHCAKIEIDPQRPTGRLLLLNSARHSYVDLADPRHLEFAYAQWMGAFIDTYQPEGPLAALHIGGGGFTMPRYLASVRPGSASRVLELDGELVNLDKAELGVRPGPDLAIEVGDARIGLGRQPTAAYDLVVGDAFGHLVVPWHLTTKELVTDVRRVLRPGGAYALNVIDYPPDHFVRAELATIQTVFAHVALVAPAEALDGERGSNFVILASDSPLKLDDLGAALATLDAPPVLLTGDDLADFVAGARVLTDDYAPVDQLLGTG
jgi:hypothetical protein